MLQSKRIVSFPLMTLTAGLSLVACSGGVGDETPTPTVADGFNPDNTVTEERDSGATVVIYDFGDLWVHNYNDNPANGVGNATYIIESGNSLVLIDAQFFPDSATDFRAYADELNKPIDRILITHGHPDHVGGLAVAFSDVTSYSSEGVIAEALADSGAVINEEIGATAEIDGVAYSFDVRQNLEASEQVIITLPDYGVRALGDLFYNKYHAVMNPGFDGWIAALEELGDADLHLYLSGHGLAGTDVSEVTEAVGYLETGREAYAASSNGDEFYAAMVAAYPDYSGEFLLQLSAYQALFPTPYHEVDYGDCDELAVGSVASLADLQALVPEGIHVESLTEMGTVFPGSDDLGVLLTRALSCASITVDGVTETNVHIAQVGTGVDTSSLPPSPYSTDGDNGADFSNYTFSYVTDSVGFLAAMTDAGVAGAGSATITFNDVAAGECTVDRQVVVAGGDFDFSATGTLPDARCADANVPFVGNWWSVTEGQVSVLSHNIVGQAALFLDPSSTPVLLDPEDGSSLAALLGDDSSPVDAFVFAGFIPEAEGVDMIVTVAGSIE